MRDFHVLETQVQVMIDFMGKRTKMWVTISGGRESHKIASSSSVKDLETSGGELSDIAATSGVTVKVDRKSVV